jgi:hypothetical protein
VGLGVHGRSSVGEGDGREMLHGCASSDQRSAMHARCRGARDQW